MKGLGISVMLRNVENVCKIRNNDGFIHEGLNDDLRTRAVPCVVNQTQASGSS